MGQIFKRTYVVRRASVRGKEVSLPPEAPVKSGDKVLVFYDGFVLYVPRSTKVDETLLRHAIAERTEAVRNDESVSKPLPETLEAEVPKRDTKPIQITCRIERGSASPAQKQAWKNFWSRIIAEVKHVH